MKTNFKRIGKQSISIVLAVMMMLSTMLVGMVTSNAATAHFYVVGDPVNSNDWNQMSAIIDGNYGSDGVYYIDIELTNGCYFALHNGSHRYSPNTDGEEIGLNTIQSSNAYNANNRWHYTGDTGTKRIVVDQSVKDWYPTVRIENIPSTTTHNVTANFSNATVKLGNDTLTSGTPKTVDNNTDYTLTVKPDEGYTLTSVKFGGEEKGTNGTYTLAAGTDDVTIDITTENSTENDYEFYVTGYMDGKDLIIADNYKFTKESDGIYTCTMKPTADLYVTITDNSTNTTYWSKRPENLTENTYSTEPIVTGGGDKWGILGQAGKEIKITFNITAGIENGQIKWEYAVTDPVSVTLTPVLDVEGGAAYISSYTDNDTGNIVNNTDETVQSVNAKPGTSVTFKAKSVDGYFPKWKFGGKFATGDTYTLDASSVTGTTPVTVYLTYEKIQNHNITVESNKGGNVSYTYNGTEGSVPEGTTSSAIPVASNSTITLTANADTDKDYVFSCWKFDTDSNVVFATDQDSFSPSITINVVGDVKVTATFEKNSGTLSDWKFMLSNSDSGLSHDSIGTYKTEYNVYQETDGTYSVTFPASAISSNDNQFFTFSTTGTNSGFVPNDSSIKVETAANFTQYVSLAQPQRWDNNYFVIAKFQNTDDIKTIKVTYNPNTKTYIINGTYFVAPPNSHNVYATMGSQVGHKFGTTTISLLSGNKPLKTSVKDFYNFYVVNDKEQITVSCSVSKDQADLGYYVYAFVVNGEKVDVVDNGNNVYQTASPITVTENLEITPIYYNKVIEADGNYITIYTNAPAELQTLWGNSISIYSWYKGDDGKYLEMDGAYPGQLMMRDSQGRFAAKVSKYFYTNVDGKFTCDNNKKVLGITNNNY